MRIRRNETNCNMKRGSLHDSSGSNSVMCWFFISLYTSWLFLCCLADDRSDTPHDTAGCLLAWLYCTAGWQGQMVEVLGNIAREHQLLFPPPRSNLTKSTLLYVGWNQTGWAETRQAAEPFSHECCWLGMLTLHHLKDPFGLLIHSCKKQAGEGPLHRRRRFFSTPQQDFLAWPEWQAVLLLTWTAPLLSEAAGYNWGC